MAALAPEALEQWGNGRRMTSAYAWWVPLVLCLAILGCGFMLGWMYGPR